MTSDTASLSALFGGSEPPYMHGRAAVFRTACSTRYATMRTVCRGRVVHPTTAVFDTQSVKTTECGARRFDVEKKIKHPDDLVADLFEPWGLTRLGPWSRNAGSVRAATAAGPSNRVGASRLA